MSATLLSIAAIFAAVSLGVFVLFQKQQRLLCDWFLAAGLLLMAGIEAADRIALSNPEIWQSAKLTTLILESLLGTVWLLFAVSFSRKDSFRNLSSLSLALLVGSLILPAIALISPFESFFFSPDFADEHILFLGRSAYWFYLGILFFTVVALYQLERTLMAFSAMERSRALYEILGTGIILIAMLVYYSQALLHRTIDMNLVSIRSLALLVGIGLCGYSRFR
ncbi:MAG: hypothetical protein L3J79_11385, partial [Candidatus Marinimicrobia bacterium]|nr:hypothetical protein [Candidatus Neomarinimicrobiota bacterium]